jgi:hypothetical protein
VTEKPLKYRSAGHLLSWCYRSYIKATIALTLLVGSCMSFGPDDWFGNIGFNAHKSVMPIWMWGILFISAGLAFAVSLWRENVSHVKITSLYTSVVMAAWACANFGAWLDAKGSPSGAAVWFFAVAINCIAAAIPSQFAKKLK